MSQLKYTFIYIAMVMPKHGLLFIYLLSCCINWVYDFLFLFWHGLGVAEGWKVQCFYCTIVEVFWVKLLLCMKLSGAMFLLRIEAFLLHLDGAGVLWAWIWTVFPCFVVKWANKRLIFLIFYSIKYAWFLMKKEGFFLTSFNLL